MPAAPPPPHRLAARAFARYVRGLAGRHFAAVHWNGGGVVPPAPPVLLVANHSNWWDGFLACLVSARLGWHFQILMEAANLDRYWMFKWVGALPMHRDAPRRAYADLERAAACLHRGGTGLWVFPQGVRRPAAAPVQDAERGAAHLALRAGGPVTIWPATFRYAYLGEQLPEAFVWLGQPLVPEGDDGGAPPRVRRARLQQRIEAALGATAAALDTRLAQEDLRAMDLLLPGRLSVNKRLDRARHALGFLRGPFDPRNG